MAKLAVTPPVVGSVRSEMKGSRSSARRLRAAEVLAICMRERIPSCIRAPPEAETMSRGMRFWMASSMARVIFSPTTDAMLPPRNANSKTARATGWPPIRPTPVSTASSRPVLPRAALTRSVYRLVSLKPRGSLEVSPASRSSKEPSSTMEAIRSRALIRNG
jgi:hypothetical protein